LKIRHMAFLAMLAMPPPLWAQETRILNPSVRPGGVMVIRASPDTDVVVFEKTYQSNVDGFIFVGIDIRTPPGEYSLDGQVFRVEDFRPRVRRRVPSRLSARRKNELQQLEKYYSYAEDIAWYPEKAFANPLQDIFITSDFAIGHSGVDLRAARGTPVLAFNDGRVLMVARRFSLEGNMVIIDHGSGVLSLYMHLSRTSVQEGRTVKKGDTIGLSGATGAGVTGPHLHFSVKVNRINVEPLGFIETINSLFPDGIPR
jgi:hypothetical protein